MNNKISRAFYTETEKDFPIIKSIEHNPLVHITLVGNQHSDNHLEITGETEVVADQEIIDWMGQEKGMLTMEADGYNTPPSWL